VRDFEEGLTRPAFKAWVSQRLDALDTPTDLAATGRDDAIETEADSSSLAAHSPAAVLFCLVERPGGLSVIFTRRADTLRRHTGQVALPGGRCDPGETPWRTALREAEEEIGLSPSKVSLAGLSTPYWTGTGFRVTPVVGFAPPDISLKANPDEVADIFEAPFSFLMDPANYEEREGRTPAGDVRRYYALTWQDQLIWGATAAMVRALRSRLYGAATP
jgi:8-oxo-dGTP pyrophosphatase MutT (NUDIX family)